MTTTQNLDRTAKGVPTILIIFRSYRLEPVIESVGFSVVQLDRGHQRLFALGPMLLGGKS